ncbi:ROK family protein [Lachnospiraceae bacterium LCP25S3_G4]
MDNYICIDIGGTAIKYGMIDEKGHILYRESMDTESAQGGLHIMNKVKLIIKQYMGNEPKGICISTAGMVDPEKGEIFYAAPLIPNYAGTKFKEDLEKEFGIPCEVENDVNCAGLAERISGAALGSKVTLCLTIGTGIGGCILIEERIFHGFSNSACEVGYMHMFDSDFQTLGASSILSKKVAERKNDTTAYWNGIRIFENAKAGDEICIQAIEEMVDILARGISNICYVINPQIVVLGGGIMAQSEYLEEKINKALEKYLLPNMLNCTCVKFAEHKNDAGMLGAFYNFRNKHD